MHTFKTLMDNIGPDLIEKIGYFLNPLILNVKKESNQLLVFTFHGIFENLKQKELNHIDPQNNMTVEQFEEFLNYFLDHNYKFITPHDLITGLENNQSYAMLTFDDGYFNNILAFDILKKYEVPAICFLSTNNIVENKSYWWDIIYKYGIKQGNSFDAIRTEQSSLKKFKYSYINNYIEKKFGSEAFSPWSDIDRPFTENEIKSLAENPYVFFGNHTHNHSILTNCNKDEIKEELRESNKIISGLTGTVPISVAFPNGNYNKLILEATKEEGFRFGFTTEPNKNHLPIKKTDKLICFNRYTTNTEKITKFGSFCRLGYQPYFLYRDFKMKIKSVVK